MLTDKRLQSLPPRSKEYIVADAHGLSVRVWPTGVKTFQYRYRINGKLQRYTIGTYPEISLREARDRLAASRKMVEQGISPAYMKQLVKGKESESGVDTVAHLAEEFMERFVRKERKRPEHVEQMLSADVLPLIGKIKAKDITRRHVIRLLDKIVDRGAPIQANRTASMLKQMFQYAVERGVIENNPCSDIRRRTVGGTENARERNLNSAEIRTVWLGLDRLSEPKQVITKPAPGRKLKSDEKKDAWIGKAMTYALKLLLVTGQRRGELANAEWSQVDLGKAIWTIPADHSKNGKEHKVPLSHLAVNLFKKLHMLAGRSQYVFPSPIGDRPITERSVTKAGERARESIEIGHWVPHDLRRTAATQLAELGTPPHVVEKVLNHTMQGVMAVYNRHDYMQERKEALDLWAEQITNWVRAEHPRIP